MAEGLTGRVVVLSPHLDDAVFSLGATIRNAVTAGAEVTIVTVFAGDPASTRRASAWDRRAGFADEGEAVRARRTEDRLACGLVGANPVWLAFSEGSYGTRRENGALWSAIGPCLRDADLVCAPGFPLGHPDHDYLGRLVLAHAHEATVPRLALYLEQPYAVGSVRPWRWAWNPRVPEALKPAVDRPEWTVVPVERVDRATKWRSCRTYRSQIRVLRKQLPLVLTRIAMYESRRGGESLAWLRDPARG